uniref:Deoxyribonuclease I n=1 Tax=Shewanella putrefaciens (strain 200) TaxID=399804 RepID=E6XSC9_SHEP2
MFATKDLLKIGGAVGAMLSLAAFSFGSIAMVAGNTQIESFNAAKRLMQDKIYTDEFLRKTFYCGAKFDRKKHVTLPEGYQSDVFHSRAGKWEAEHIVAAESWGKSFDEWRNGHKDCVDSKGKSFKGRNCAAKVNPEFRLMHSDLYNLVPAIGSVNAARSNYNFTMLPSSKSSFGACDMRIEGRKVQPPEGSRGRIARTYLYFESTYPRYSMSKQQRQLMQVWDRQYPVTKEECEIGRRIKSLQKSENPILQSRCGA